MPGQHRLGQPDFLGQQRRHLGPGVPERRQCAGRAAELHGEPAGPDPVQPDSRLIDPGQPACGDQPERYRDRLLEERPAQHDGPGMRPGEPGRSRGRGGQIGRRAVERPSSQQHGCGVDDVLAGRAAMHGAAGRGRQHRGERAHQGGHRIAGAGRLAA